MLEPTWNPAARPRRTGRIAPGEVDNRSQRCWWLIEAAPCAVAAVWMGMTLAAMLGCAATGRRELLDWCRSDAVVAGAGTLAALAALLASARRGVRR